MFQPLEQFDINIISLFSLNFFNIFILFINNFLLYLCLTFFVIFLFFKISILNLVIIPTTWQLLNEQIYKFVYDVIRQQIGERGQIFFPLILSIFIFILISNLNGLLPYSFTTTSHIVETFTLSLICFIGIIIFGFIFQKGHFIYVVIPTGVPMLLMPMLILIEIVSYFARVFSLAIRLFANMMAGHTLLNILSGFSVIMVQSSVLYERILALIPFLLVLIIMGLEIGISILQAYVFIVLLAIYFSETFEIGH